MNLTLYFGHDVQPYAGIEVLLETIAERTGLEPATPGVTGRGIKSVN